MIAKNCDSRLPDQGVGGPAEDALAATLSEQAVVFMAEMNALKLHRALEAVMTMVTAANVYFADAAPWALKATDPARMAAVLAAVADATRRIAILIQPIIPDAAARLLDQLGVAPDARQYADLDTRVAAGITLPAPAGVFPRWVEPA